MPGAFAYHLHSFSADTLHSATHNWCGPLLAKGATCTMGCVYEPYLQFTPNIAYFIGTLGGTYTFGEAAWSAQPALSWQTTVVGDPLYQPFKHLPAELHVQMWHDKNPLIEWSFDRLICLDLAHGARELQVISFLENLGATPQSAVLTEKLASLYDATGKPSSAIDTWQKALKLKTSPQQRLRIRLKLGEKLEQLDRDAEAMENYKLLVAEMPGYPGKPQIEERVKALAQKAVATKN
jgi:tetratricopeptide (TPR) repeat protein